MTTDIYVRQPLEFMSLTPRNSTLENAIRSVVISGAGVITIPDNSTVIFRSQGLRRLEVKDQVYDYQDGKEMKKNANTGVSTYREGYRFGNDAWGELVGAGGTSSVGSIRKAGFPAVEKVVNTTNLSSGKERR